MLFRSVKLFFPAFESAENPMTVVKKLKKESAKEEIFFALLEYTVETKSIEQLSQITAKIFLKALRNYSEVAARVIIRFGNKMNDQLLESSMLPMNKIIQLDTIASELMSSNIVLHNDLFIALLTFSDLLRPNTSALLRLICKSRDIAKVMQQRDWFTDLEIIITNSPSIVTHAMANAITGHQNNIYDYIVSNTSKLHGAFGYEICRLAVQNNWRKCMPLLSKLMTQRLPLSLEAEIGRAHV